MTQKTTNTILTSELRTFCWIDSLSLIYNHYYSFPYASKNSRPFFQKDLYKNIDGYSFAHIFVVIKALEKKGFIVVKKDGRSNTLWLTPRGSVMAQSCSTIVEGLK
jgi:hypothetical protein